MIMIKPPTPKSTQIIRVYSQPHLRRIQIQPPSVLGSPRSSGEIVLVVIIGILAAGVAIYLGS